MTETKLEIVLISGSFRREIYDILVSNDYEIKFCEKPEEALEQLRRTDPAILIIEESSWFRENRDPMLIIEEAVMKPSKPRIVVISTNKSGAYNKYGHTLDPESLNIATAIENALGTYKLAHN